MSKVDTGKRFYDARTKLNKNNAGNDKPESIRKVYLQTKVPASSILKYENGERLPQTKNAQKLADHYGVNVLWLLGKSESWSIDENSQIVTKITGLSADVIEWLCELDSDKKECINTLLSSSNFHKSLYKLSQARKMSDNNTQDDEEAEQIERSNAFESEHFGENQARYSIPIPNRISNRQYIQFYRNEALQDMGNAFRNVAPIDSSEKGDK